MKNYLPSIALVAIFMLSCSKQSEKSTLTTINIENAIDNPTELKASKIGKSIRYVALDTRDSLALIGANPTVRKVGNKLIVASNAPTIKVFDATTGKFLHTIGEINKGPRGSGILNNYILNPYSNAEVIVPAMIPNEYRVWNIDGNFLRTLTIPKSLQLNSRQFFGLPNNLVCMSGNEFAYYSYDSISCFVANDTVYKSVDLPTTGYYFGKSFSGSWGKHRVSKVGTLSDGGCRVYKPNGSEAKKISFNGERPFHYYKDKLYFKDIDRDSLYLVLRDSIRPVMAFNVGKHAYTEQEKIAGYSNAKRVKIGQITENDNFVFFECVIGYDEEGLHGLYDKSSDQVTAYDGAIVDDINDFMPFNIHAINPEGGYLALLDALKIVEWTEENPTKKNPLPTIKDDANLVVAIIE